MPAIVYLFAGTKNLCPGTRMARSYTRTNHRLVRGRHPQEVAMQATCHQPKAGQDRHHRGCKGLITQSGNPLPAKGWTELTQPQQHTQEPLLQQSNHEHLELLAIRELNRAGLLDDAGLVERIGWGFAEGKLSRLPTDAFCDRSPRCDRSTFCQVRCRTVRLAKPVDNASIKARIAVHSVQCHGA